MGKQKSTKSTKKVHTKKGGFKNPQTHMSSQDLSKLLKETYRKGKGANEDVGDYKIDKELSTGRAKVYHNEKTGKVVVAHRGSTNLQDWKENLNYALGIEKKGKAYKKSKKVQEAAEKKYGTANLETIGHSKGALHAERLGQKGLVQTLNKPVNIRDTKRVVGANQIDYKSSRDPVSLLRGFQNRGEKARVIRSTTYNPLTEHGLDVLDRKHRWNASSSNDKQVMKDDKGRLKIHKKPIGLPNPHSSMQEPMGRPNIQV